MTSCPVSAANVAAACLQAFNSTAEALAVDTGLSCRAHGLPAEPEDVQDEPGVLFCGPSSGAVRVQVSALNPAGVKQSAVSCSMVPFLPAL